MEASNLAFIIAAYAVTWLVLLGYLGRIVQLGRRARAEHDRAVQGLNGENR